MPLPLLVPPFPPSVEGTSARTSIAVRETRFGDGYGQRRPDGLNPQRRRVRLVWKILTHAEAAALRDFLLTNAITGFRYTFPTETTERNWRVDGDIEDPPSSGLHVDLSVDLVEVFDLG